MAAIKRKATSKSARRTRPRAVKAKPAAKPVAKGPRRKRIDPGWSWDDRYPLAQGIHSGQTIFVSGQLALGPSGEVVGLGDIKAQTHQAFRNIATILEQAGAGLKDIVKITSFLTDENAFGDMLEARREVFGDDPPASTAVVVRQLAIPGCMIEIEAIAIAP
jgi:reactive intermediate/imine deaminase